jgi:hypothetical protein
MVAWAWRDEGPDQTDSTQGSVKSSSGASFGAMAS